MSAPKPLARKFDTGAQTANSDILSKDVDPSDAASSLRVTVALKSAAVVNIAEGDGNSTVAYELNSGATLDADELHVFDVPVRAGSSYNVRVGSSVGIKVLNIDEVADSEV